MVAEGGKGGKGGRGVPALPGLARPYGSPSVGPLGLPGGAGPLYSAHPDAGFKRAGAALRGVPHGLVADSLSPVRNKKK